MNDIANAAFDYGDMSAADKETLRECAVSVRKTTAEAVLTIGRNLAEAQSLLAQHGNGQFGKWLELECRISSSTAYRCIKVHEQFGGRKVLPNWDKLEASALYVLSNSTDEAIDEAVELTASGAKVSRAKAKEIVEKHRASDPTPPDATEVPEPSNPGSGTENPSGGTAKPDYGKCPNCGGSKWVEDPFGAICAKCTHPHGEPVGDADDDRIRLQRSKTVKTAESLMRAFDDLNTMQPNSSEHAEAVAKCKVLLKSARDWK